MTNKPATAANTFFVTFHGVDCLNVGPFPSYEAATAWGKASVFFATGQRFEVHGLVAPRPDHVASAKPVKVTTTPVGVKSAGVGVQSDAPLYRQEFPDFDYEIPAIPGMVDHSWHNDVCPSLVGNGFQLWCDYADTALREMEGGDRFALYVDLDGSMGDLILSSDSLDAIKAAMATATTAA